MYHNNIFCLSHDITKWTKNNNNNNNKSVVETPQNNHNLLINII